MLRVAGGLTLLVLLSPAVAVCAPPEDETLARFTVSDLAQPEDAQPIIADPPARDPFVDDDPMETVADLVPEWDDPVSLWAVRADYAAWWLKGNLTPPLVTTSADTATRDEAGVIGRDDTSVLLGDGRLDDGARHGGRLSVIRWLDDAQSIGAQISFAGTGGDDTHYSAASDGLPILGRPFHNVLTGAEHAALVAYPNVIRGTVEVDTSSELYSVSALLRRTCVRRGAGYIDVIGGYRFFRYREGLAIGSDLVALDPTGPVQIGTEFDLLDTFDAETNFHGGEIGFAAEMVHGPFSLEAVTKLGIGGVRQRVRVGGRTTVTTPGGMPTTAPGALLALPTNMGSFTRHRFALLPELDLTLRCRLLECLTVTVGYNLIYLTEAVRTGDQIDYHINPTLLPGSTNPVTGELRPTPQLKSTSLWAQGINVGGEIRF